MKNRQTIIVDLAIGLFIAFVGMRWGLMVGIGIWAVMALAFLAVHLYLERKIPGGDPEILRYEMSAAERANLSLYSSPWDVLIREGFDPDKEIVWWDDPVYNRRIFTQEKTLKE